MVQLQCKTSISRRQPSSAHRIAMLGGYLGNRADAVRPVFSWCFQLVNKVLRVIGFRLQRTSSPTRTFADFFDHLKSLNFEFRTVIDVGVGRGTPQIYRAFPRARYFLVEPLEEFRGTLEKLCRDLDADYFLAAAGASNGAIVINLHDDLSGSSVLAQAEGEVFDGTKRRVPLVRLDSILPESPESPCLLKIDVQGTELDVLEGLGDRIEAMDVIIVETSLMPFRVNVPEFADVIARLHELGLVIYDILEGHVRHLDNALAQVDLVFVKKTSPLRQDPRFFSSDQLRQYSARWRKPQRAS